MGLLPEGGDGVEHLLGLGDGEAPAQPQLGLGLQGVVQGDGDLLGGRLLQREGWWDPVTAAAW